MAKAGNKQKDKGASQTANKNAKKKENTTSESLGWDGYLLLFLLLGVGGAFGYNQWLSQQVPQEQQIQIPDCGCGRAWEPVCAEFIEEIPETEKSARGRKKKKKKKKQGNYKEVDGTRTHYIPFPNKCEAECYGHGVWTQGHCEGASENGMKAMQCLYDNKCPFPDSPEGQNPVCFHGITYPNSCTAKCHISLDYPTVELTSSSLVEGACKDPCKKSDCHRKQDKCNLRPGIKTEEFKGYACMGRYCECLPLWDPHCDLKTGVTYTNECYAKCEHIENPTKGACAEKNPFVKWVVPLPEQAADSPEEIELLKRDLGLDGQNSMEELEKQGFFLPDDEDVF